MVGFIFLTYSFCMIMALKSHEAIDSMLFAGWVFITVFFIFITLNSIKVIKQEKGVKLKRNINYNFGVILSVFGIFLYIFSSMLIQNIFYRINGVETVAKVYSVKQNISYKTKYDNEGNSYEEKIKNCDNYVTYYVDEKRYNSKLNSKVCKYRVNDKVKIYYDKNNPKKIESNSVIILVLVNILIWSLFIIFIYQFLKSKKKVKRKNKK